MDSTKRIAMTVLAAAIVASGTAHAVQYYNLTQLSPGTTDYVANPATFNEATINGAIFTTATASYSPNVGTGVLDPFLRVQATNTNSGVVNSGANCGGNDPCIELGYNTNGSGIGSKKPEFQTKDNEGSNWNHTLKLSDIGTETINGTVYRTFILDINERMASGSGHDEFLSLDQFRIFASDDSKLDKYGFGGTDPTSWKAHVKTAGATSYDTNAHTLTSQDGSVIANKVFDMDFNDLLAAQTKACANETNPANPNEPNPLGQMCDRTIGLNYALNSGSGNGLDLVVRVPDALFVGKGENIYLFSSFGEMGKNDNTNHPSSQLPTGDFSQSAGFEEWSTLKSSTTPIAPTLALMLVGLIGMGGSTRFRARARFA